MIKLIILNNFFVLIISPANKRVEEEMPETVSSLRRELTKLTAVLSISSGSGNSMSKISKNYRYIKI